MLPEPKETLQVAVLSKQQSETQIILTHCHKSSHLRSWNMKNSLIPWLKNDWNDQSIIKTVRSTHQICLFGVVHLKMSENRWRNQGIPDILLLCSVALHAIDVHVLSINRYVYKLPENCEKWSQNPKWRLQVAPFVQLTVRNTNNLHLRSQIFTFQKLKPAKVFDDLSIIQTVWSAHQFKVS